MRVDAIKTTFNEWGKWLVTPAATLTDPFERLRSQLLASIIIAFFILIVPLSSARIFPEFANDPRQEGLPVIIAVSSVLFISYLINRMGYYSQAATLMTLAAMIIPFGFAARTDFEDLTPLRYLIVAIIGSSVFLSIRATIVIVSFDIFGLFLLALFNPHTSFVDIAFDPLRLNLIIGVVVVASLYYQRRLYEAQQGTIRQNEERLRIVNQLVSDYAFALVVDSKNSLHIEWITDAFQRIAGYSEQELKDDWTLATHPDDLHIIQEHIRVLMSGKSDISEFRIITKAGKIEWLRNHGTPILEDQRVIRVYGAGQTITLQKQVEAARQASETQKMAILNAIPDLMLRISREGIYLDYYAGNPDDLVVPPEEFLGKHVMEILPPPVNEQTMNLVQLTLDTREMQAFEYQLTLQGQIQHYEARMVISGENEVLSIVRNVSVRKQAEQALHASENRVRQLIEYAPIPMFASSEGKDIMFINARFIEVFGYTDKDIQRVADWDHLAYPDEIHRQQVINRWSNAIAKASQEGKVIISQEEQVTCKDGSVREVEMSLVIIGSYHILTALDITERKQQEAQLRQSQARYQAVVESQTELVCRYTPDLTITFVNEAYARSVGKTPEALVGTSILSFIPNEQHQNVRQHVKSLMENRRTVVYEGQSYSSEGTLRWLKWTDQVILNSEGKITEIQGVGSDITELKEARDQAQQHIEEMRFLRRIDRELGYNLEIDTIVNLAMDMAVRRSGAKSCEVGWFEENTRLLKPIATIGKSSFLTENDYTDQIDKLFDTPKRRRHFVHQNNGDISIFFGLEMRGEIRGVMILDKLPTDSIATLNIDFLIQLADRLAAGIQNANAYQYIQRHATQMELLYQLSYELAATLDYNQVMATAVRVLLDLLNGSSAFAYEYDLQTHRGRIHTQFAQPEATEDIRQNDAVQQYLIKTQYTPQSHVLLRRAAPDISPEAEEMMEVLDVQSMLILPLGEDRIHYEMLVLCESRYARYFLEEEITLALNLLGQVMVALQRARVIANLQELESVKSEMIRVASHDLRGPVSQIQGYMELLEGDIGDNKTSLQVEFIQSIYRGIAKMKQLLEDILNLERVESQRSTSWQAVNIRPILENVVTMLVTQADLKQQAYEVNIPKSIPPIIGSDIQLEQACINLVHNAVKYTPEGGSIWVRGDIRQDRFYFEVEDTGYGIPQDRQIKLFQRFYRAIAPGTEHIGGTGLGLSLVKSVIERHGGGVYFSSQLGVGSTFGFWLPLRKPTQNLVDPPHH